MGRRISSGDISSIAIAALIGIGLVAMLKQAFAEGKELVVPSAGGDEIAFENQIGHGLYVGRDDIGNDADDTLAADRADGQRERIVAGKNRQVAACGDLAGHIEAAGGFLDGDDIFDCGKANDRVGRHARAASAGNIVEDHRKIDFFGDGLKVLVEAFLRGLIVIRRNLQRGIGADFFGELGKFDGLGGAVGAGAGDDGDFAADGFYDVLDDLLYALRG